MTNFANWLVEQRVYRLLLSGQHRFLLVSS